MSSEDTNLDHENQYLIFSIHQELYAAPLMGVREVIEPIHIRPIPNTVDYFLGIINMRGEIIGVVDLRIRFGAICTDSPMKAMVIFESPVGPMAVVVDKIESVSTIDKTQIGCDHLLMGRSG